MSDDPRIEAAAHCLNASTDGSINLEQARRYAKKMLAAADRAAWRPISEAPTDGKPFLAYTIERGWGDPGPKYQTEIAKWIPGSSGGTGRFASRSGAIAIRYQPLPAPPEDSQEQEEGRD